jgi:crotonobetainyl-CoA:carnitine CoA-transferase CaiB-like acyl-CoA transferase
MQNGLAGPASTLGDKAESSLMSASSLVGCAFLYGEPPAHQCGPQALGRTSTQRAYQVADGWVYALASEDMSAALSQRTVQQALAFLGARGIESARVNTVREMADRHREAISHTIRFQERQHAGWVTECFVPTWFCFNSYIPENRHGAVRIGSSADEVLQELNYAAGEIDQFKADRVILGTEWT